MGEKKKTAKPRGIVYRVFTDKEIKAFEDKYLMIPYDEYMIVKNKGRDYIRAYNINRKFRILLDIDTKITILPQVIEIWRKSLVGYSIFRVQNAYNVLVVFHKEINKDTLKAEMDKELSKAEEEKD